MATGQVKFHPLSFILPDGSTNNLGPAFTRRIGSQTGAKVFDLTADFDGGGALEQVILAFRVPADFASAPALKIHWTANATANSCKWQAKVSCVTPSDADTPIEHAFGSAATVTTATDTNEARRLNASTIDLSSVSDSMAAGDMCHILLYRDSADGSDTLTVDAEVWFVDFEYTTV